MPRLSPLAWTLLSKVPGNANEINVDVLTVMRDRGLVFAVLPGAPRKYDAWLMETARGTTLKIRLIALINRAGGMGAVDMPDPLPRGPECYCGEVAISWTKDATHYRFRFHHVGPGHGALLGTSEFGVDEIDRQMSRRENIARLALMHALLTAVVPLPASALEWTSNGRLKLRRNSQ